MPRLYLTGLLLTLALPLCQPASQAQAPADTKMRRLPSIGSVARTTLLDGSKSSRFTNADGSSCEVIEHRDRSREMTYYNADGSRMIITTDASGRGSAVLIDRNGHRRELTREGCDDRLRSGPLPANTSTSATQTRAQTGVQQFR